MEHAPPPHPTTVKLTLMQLALTIIGTLIAASALTLAVMTYVNRERGRPIIGVTSVSMAHPSVGSAMATEVIVRNNGNKTAHNIRSQISGVVVDDPTKSPPPMTAFTVAEHISLTTLDAGGTRPLFKLHTNEPPINQADVALLLSKKWIPWVTGRIEYQDEEGKTYFTMFRAYYDVDQRMFAFANPGTSQN